MHTRITDAALVLPSQLGADTDPMRFATPLHKDVTLDAGEDAQICVESTRAEKVLAGFVVYLVSFWAGIALEAWVALLLLCGAVLKHVMREPPNLRIGEGLLTCFSEEAEMVCFAFSVLSLYFTSYPLP